MSLPSALNLPANDNRVCVEALCYYEALRRLGCPAKDIYVLPAELDDGACLYVVLIHGDREFRQFVGALHVDLAAFLEAWPKLIGWWNHETEVKALVGFYRHSKVICEVDRFAHRLEAEGFLQGAHVAAQAVTVGEAVACRK